MAWTETASMRPGQEGPGYPELCWLAIPHFHASMRPGQEGPGYPTLDHAAVNLSPASMRPGQEGPGYPSVQTPDTKREFGPVCERVGFCHGPDFPLTTDEACSNRQSPRRISRLAQFERSLGNASCLTARFASARERARLACLGKMGMDASKVWSGQRRGQGEDDFSRFSAIISRLPGARLLHRSCRCW